MPALKQTVYLQFEVEQKTRSFTASKFVGCDFVPDYLRVKQVIWHNDRLNDDLDPVGMGLVMISSPIVEGKILGAIMSNTSITPDVYFPVGRAMNSNFDFHIECNVDDVLGGFMVLALEFTKELVHHK